MRIVEGSSSWYACAHFEVTQEGHICWVPLRPGRTREQGKYLYWCPSLGSLIYCVNPGRPSWVTADLLAGEHGAVGRQMDQLDFWLNTRSKITLSSSIMSSGGTFTLEKPTKSWNMVYYCMKRFSKHLIQFNSCRTYFCLRKNIHCFFLEGSAGKLLLDLNFCLVNSVDAFGVPKHLTVISFDTYFCGCFTCTTVAVTLRHTTKCSEAFVIS